MPPKKRAADDEAPALQTKSRKLDQDVADDEDASRDGSVEVVGEGEVINSQEEDESSDDELSEEKLKTDPYSYLAMCPPLFDFKQRQAKKKQEEDPEYDEYEQSDQLFKEWAEMHNTKKCACFAPHDGAWFVTRKGEKRMNDIEIYEVPQRDPDSFGMHVNNNFRGYGYQEVIENCLQEFNDTNSSKYGKSEELWTIIESMSLWLNKDLSGDMAAWHMIDDGRRMCHTVSIIGYALLTGLNRIDREGDLRVDGKYKNLSLVLALWVRFGESYGQDITDLFDYDPYASDADSSNDIGGQGASNLTWIRLLLALVKQNNIPITGVCSVEDTIEKKMQAASEVKLPRKAIDRFKWKPKFKEFREEYTPRVIRTNRDPVGGDFYKITAWTRTERAKYAFDKKDPLSDEVVEALKAGMVMQFR